MDTFKDFIEAEDATARRLVPLAEEVGGRIVHFVGQTHNGPAVATPDGRIITHRWRGTASKARTDPGETSKPAATHL